MKDEQQVVGALALFVFVGLTLSRQASAAEFASIYTHHDFAQCREEPSPEPGVVDVRSCAGLAGLRVFWTGEPDASSVDFGGVSKEPLGLGSFHEPRSTIEWRGPLVRGAIEPMAAIVRYDSGPSVGRLNASRLVVYRLKSNGRSCIMAVVGGADANAEARRIIDQKAQGFVCGRSSRIGGA